MATACLYVLVYQDDCTIYADEQLDKQAKQGETKKIDFMTIFREFPPSSCCVKCTAGSASTQLLVSVQCLIDATLPISSPATYCSPAPLLDRGGAIRSNRLSVFFTKERSDKCNLTPNRVPFFRLNKLL